MTTREKLANLLCQHTGCLFTSDNIHQTNAAAVRDGVCRWDAYGTRPADATRPAKRVHAYSWDTMTECVRHGIDSVHYSQSDGVGDIEISRRDSK